MKRLVVIVCSLLSVLACSFEELEQEEIKPEATELVEMRFDLDIAGATRSSISIDDVSIRDINIYAFHNGILVDEVYSTALTGVVLHLPGGSSYNIYAVANMGHCPADPYEAGFVSDLKYSIASLQQLTSGVPMSCVVKNVYLGGSAINVKLPMVRNTARITLSVDRSSLLDGLVLKSVRLCQSASVVRPFKWIGEGGSRAESEDEVINGDYATSTDLELLNSGETVTFYSLENCQGILLPDNTDPSMKTPDAIGNKSKLCTYLEVSCGFDGSGLLEGDVSYRIYLGLDACTSFDIPGNASINIKLMLTEDGLRNVSWKADADVAVRNGYVYGEVSHGRSGMSDLYVGEIILYDVTFADELVEFLGGDVEGCTLRLISDGEEVSGVEADFCSGDSPYAVIRCVDIAEGGLYLYDPEGECIGCLEEDVRIKLPRMVISEYSSWGAEEPVEPFTYIPECDLNGDPADLYVYLIDSGGYNLNSIYSYGFDNSLFDFYDCGTRSDDVSLNAFMAQVDMLDTVVGRAAAHVSLTCSNSGQDHDQNLLLAAIYAWEKPAVLTLGENNFQMSSKLTVGLGIPPITLTLVDNGWAGYFSCQLAMKVENPSNLPVNVSVWQLIATNSSYGASDADYVEENLVIDHMEYMTGAFYNGDPHLYGMSSTFYSERNDEGDLALTDGQALVYPLSDISTNDIIKAAYYNRKGTGQMIHAVDVTLAGRRLRSSDIMLEDMVSNGSLQYDYIYYDQESWNYRGAALFSADRAVSSPERWAYDYPNMTPRNLDRLEYRWDSGATVSINMKYEADEGKSSAMTYAGQGAQYGLTLAFEYTGTVNGYVQTYPNGTWRDPKDNKCSAAVSYTKSGVALVDAGQSVLADDGCLKAAMDQIYGHSYTDSDRPLGANSYMHRAHPTEMDLGMNLCVEGDKGSELYPYYLAWDTDYLEYYHTQESKTYKCKLNCVINAYKLSIVRHR